MGWSRIIQKRRAAKAASSKTSASAGTSAVASTGTSIVGGPAYAPSTVTRAGTAVGKTPLELEREKEEQLKGIVQTYEPNSNIEESAKKDTQKSFRELIIDSSLIGNGSPLKIFRKKLLGF